MYLIKTLKKVSLLSLLLSLFSCGFIAENSKAQNTTSTPIEKTPYTVTPRHELPKFKTLNTAFAKQKHRFEIHRCEFKYNDQTFFIGDSMEKVISVLGEPDGSKNASDDGSFATFFFKKMKFRLRFSLPNKKLKHFLITLSDDNKHEDTPYEIIKFREVPYQLDMTLNEFMELSDLEHDENLKHGSHAFYIIDEKECPNTKKLKTIIGSDPSYEGIVSGGGHMTSTRNGDFKPEDSYPIEYFSISLKK